MSIYSHFFTHEPCLDMQQPLLFTIWPNAEQQRYGKAQNGSANCLWTKILWLTEGVWEYYSCSNSDWIRYRMGIPILCELELYDQPSNYIQMVCELENMWWAKEVWQFGGVITCAVPKGCSNVKELRTDVLAASQPKVPGQSGIAAIWWNKR